MSRTSFPGTLRALINVITFSSNNGTEVTKAWDIRNLSASDLAFSASDFLRNMDKYKCQMYLQWKWQNKIKCKNMLTQQGFVFYLLRWLIFLSSYGTYKSNGDGTISRRMSTKHVLNLYDSLILSHNIGFIKHGRKSIISIAVYGPSKLFSYKLEASHKLTHPSIASKMQSKSKHIIHSTTPRKLKCKTMLI